MQAGMVSRIGAKRVCALEDRVKFRVSVKMHARRRADEYYAVQYRSTYL